MGLLLFTRRGTHPAGGVASPPASAVVQFTFTAPSLGECCEEPVEARERLTMHTSERTFIEFDFSSRLVGGVTIGSLNAITDNGKGIVDPVGQSVDGTNTKVRLWVVGIPRDYDGRITCTVNTSQEGRRACRGRVSIRR